MSKKLRQKTPKTKEELLRLTDETVVKWANSDHPIAKAAVEVIFVRYSNLIKSVIYSQRDLRYTEEDKKDVKSRTYEHFMVRLRKFNPQRKVPFAGYIKRMLNQDIMNDYGGKKNAQGNVGLRQSFCRRWAHEINFTDYVNRICGDDYDIDEVEIVLRNANGEFGKKIDSEPHKMEIGNDLNEFWKTVRQVLSYKKFLVLYYYYKEGLNEREIGELLNIKQNTVSGHKTDAEKKLKKSRLLKSKFDLGDLL